MLISQYCYRHVTGHRLLVVVLVGRDRDLRLVMSVDATGCGTMLAKPSDAYNVTGHCYQLGQCNASSLTKCMSIIPTHRDHFVTPVLL